jgi:hypothetical protein
MAAADSLIAAWHQKFTTNFLRPVTAIRNARKLDNPAIQEDPDWTPLLVTPAHPDYPSGHCAYEGAAIRVLQLFFGTDQTKASYTYPPNAITLRWASYSQMANEVGDARVWGGIHKAAATAAIRMRLDSELFESTNGPFLGGALLDKQQATLFRSIEGVHRLVQSCTLHQPRLKIPINIQHEH